MQAWLSPHGAGVSTGDAPAVRTEAFWEGGAGSAQRHRVRAAILRRRAPSAQEFGEGFRGGARLLSQGGIDEARRQRSLSDASASASASDSSASGRRRRHGQGTQGGRGITTVDPVGAHGLRIGTGTLAGDKRSDPVTGRTQRTRHRRATTLFPSVTEVLRARRLGLGTGSVVASTAGSSPGSSIGGASVDAVGGGRVLEAVARRHDRRVQRRAMSALAEQATGTSGGGSNGDAAG